MIITTLIRCPRLTIKVRLKYFFFMSALSKEMFLTIWINTVLMIITLTVCTVESGSRVIVRPTGSYSSLCRNHTPCDTLSNFLSKKSNIFNDTTYTIYKFLQGTHELQLKNTITTLLMSSSMNLEWYGEEAENTEIICQSPLAFVFVKITSLSIKSLKFSSCGHTYYDQLLDNILPNEYHVSHESAALVLAEVTSFHMHKVIIEGSKGYGLLGLNLRGANSINSSHLCGNRSKSKKLKLKGARGNAAFYFYERKRKKKEEVTLSITHSALCNGIDNTDSSTCSILQYKSLTNFIFKANGLVIVAGQETYRVGVKVINTSFTKNYGNRITHPAVWVHDYGGVVNNSFEFIGCTFEKEATFRVSSLENKKCGEKESKRNSIMCYKNDRKNPDPGVLIPHAKITNCSFIESERTAVEICVQPTYVKYNKFQLILIEGCTFKESKSAGKSVVSIEYITKLISSPHYPSVVITIAQSHFSSNKIPALKCQLGPDNYAKHFSENNYEYPVLINLRENTFENNTNSKGSTVQIKALKNYIIPIWKYEKSVNERGNVVSRVQISKCTFIGNKQHGSIKIENVYIILNNSTFESSIGTALYALHSVVQFEGNNRFIRNNGTFGGALNLNLSRVVLTSESYTLITNNSAVYGGGIFAIADMTRFTTERSTTYNRCSISHEETGNFTSRIQLAGNKADDNSQGHSIFGGTYNRCRFICKERNSCKCESGHFLETLARDNNDSINSEIVCPPSKLCICEDSHDKLDKCNNICTKTDITRTAFPGQTIKVPLAAFGELSRPMDVVVTGTICKHISQDSNKCKADYKNDIGYGQRMQELNQNCSNRTYTIHSRSQVFIEIKIDHDETPNIMYQGTKLIEYVENEDRVIVKVDLLPCPTGFFMDQVSNEHGESSVCKCLPYFTSQGIICNITNGTVIKPKNKWIISNSSALVIPRLINKTIVHNSCPYDYCIQSETAVNLINPDEQCNHERSGILCGACPANLSAVLGTSNCKKCENIYLLLIIPFALAGVALVILLLKCNLTVSVGHINGIIFYVNIVQVNKALLFQNQSTVFSTFISWLNLDLGIKTCFFENMSTYVKAWLQFVFPVYLWIIVAVIITATRLSSRLGKLIGENSVPVLATLFLFSYAKILRAITAVLSFTFIEFKDKELEFVTVWLKNGNIEYFSREHLPLFLVALIFIILYVIPLTLLVMLAPCLQAWSHYKAFKWVNRLKPFLDAYEGPYKDKFRYWTGLLLFIRILLSIIDESNYENDPSISFFCTLSVTVPLVVVLFSKEVYRHRSTKWLELLSILNIVIMFSLTWLLTTIGYEKWRYIRDYPIYISVTVTALTFLGIVLFQLMTIVYPRILNKQNYRPLIGKMIGGANVDHELNTHTPTSSVVELEDSNQLRESLLDSN